MTRNPRRALLAALAIATFASPALAEETCSLDPTGEMTTVILGARTYQVYAPESLASLPPGSDVPLLLSLHGLLGSGSNHGPNTGWIEFSESHPMVVVFPDGFRSWDNHEDSIDVAYVREVIAHVRSTYCIDPARIHATGHSNGSFMSQRLACDVYDLVASIAPYAGGRPDNGVQGGPCSPERAVPVALFHGDADAIINVRQGMSTRDGWIDRHDCDTVPVVEETADGTEEIYLHCEDGAEVRWHVYPGQPHAWPEGERRDDLLERIWAFFERFPHPAPWDEGTTLPSNELVLPAIDDVKARTVIERVAPDPFAPPADTTTTVELAFSLEENRVGPAGPPIPGCDPRPLANRLVTVSLDGVEVAGTTDGDGRVEVTLPVPPSPGLAELRAAFEGDPLTDSCPGRAGRYKETVTVGSPP